MRLPEELNEFYACLEATNTETCMIASADPDDCVITLSTADVSKTVKQAIIHKAAGPDGLPGCELTLTNWQVSSLTFSTSPYPSL